MLLKLVIDLLSLRLDIHARGVLIREKLFTMSARYKNWMIIIILRYFDKGI